ncbi:MAG: ThuA domain-containing protein [Verrucomicrobiota bacterium]|nr:ThuA domain-containing protein [Verrucomicrobiota bacterium]
MKYTSRFFLLAALGALMVFERPAQAAPKKILVITQSRGFTHGVVRRPGKDQLCVVEKTLAKIGKESGVFTTVNSQDAIKSITRENLKNFDGIFFYTTGVLLPAGDPREALMDFIKSGKAFVGTHSAGDTFHGRNGFESYVKMINGSFAGHPWNAGSTNGFLNHEPKHPTVAMLGKEFMWKDEIYQYNNFDPNAVRVLFSLNMAKSKPQMPYHVPVCWVRSFGQGRVFFTNLGHNKSTWDNPTYHKHLVEGFKWALKITDGPSVPNPDMQAQESMKAFALFAAQKLKLNEAELMKKLQAKADDAKFIQLLRDNSWKSRGRNMKLIQEVLDAL